MSEYWESRKVDDIFDQNTDDVIDTLKKIYRRQGREIQKAITDIYIKMLEDGGISTTELYKFNRFKDLLNEINSILKSYGEQEIKTVSKGLEQATRDIIGDISKNSNISFTLVNDKVIEEIVNTKFKGESFSKRIWKNRDALGKLIEKNLQDIVASGMNKDKAVQQIMDIHNSSFNNADRLVRTETMRCINSGQIETYKARGRTHGYYSYSKDKRTCDKCKKLGEYTKKKPLPLEELEPVHHPNCRCTVIPVVDLKKYEKYDTLKYRESKSIKEAEEYARNTLNIKNVSYKGCDLKTANEWNKGLYDNFRRFPELKKEFNFVGECYERNKLIKLETKEYYISLLKEKYPYAKNEEIKEVAEKQVKDLMKNLTIGKSTYAQSWSPNHSFFDRYKGITVNKHWGKNSNEFTDMLKRDVDSKFHPIGCDTIRSVLDHEIGHQIDDLLGISNLKEIKELYEKHTNEELTEHISKYSWDNNNPNKYSEFIAEGWAEYCNNTNPREIAKTIGEIIEREYNRWKKK